MSFFRRIGNVLNPPEAWEDIPREFRRLHDDAINIASQIQAAASKRFFPLKYPPVSEAAFHRVQQFALVQHRAVLSLCDHGWSQAAPPNVRTHFECLINLAVIAHSDSEFRAAQYLYGHLVVGLRKPDPSIPLGNAEKEELQEQLNLGLATMEGPLKSRVLEWATKAKPPGTYWYGEYFNGPTAVIENLLPVMKYMYRLLSANSHAGFFGTYFFMDDPRDANINPRRNPKAATLLIAASCRFAIEISHLRAQFQDLEFEDGIQELRQRLAKLQPESAA